MGIFDVIKDLIGSSGVSDLVESTGIADQLGGLTEAVQAPIDGLETAAADVTEAIDPLTGQL